MRLMHRRLYEKTRLQRGRFVCLPTIAKGRVHSIPHQTSLCLLPAAWNYRGKVA